MAKVTKWSKKTVKKPKTIEAQKQAMVEQMMQKWPKNPLLWVFVLALWIALLYGYKWTGVIQEPNDKISLSEIQAKYASGIYDTIILEGNTIRAEEKPRKEFSQTTGKEIMKQWVDKTLAPPHDSIKDLGFFASGSTTKIVVRENTWGNIWKELLPTIISVVLMGVLIMFIISKVAGGGPGGGGGPMAFIKSKARRFDPDDAKNNITFADVAGAVEEKEELQEVVDFLKNPDKYKKLGAKIPKGILMVGPPGTGKTLLARAVAWESGVPFFFVSGSEFVEMFVWVGAARVRDLFKEAKEASPAIIFIDEIDAIGKKRSVGVSGGNDEREQTLNQILTEMDGFDNETNLIIMAATNRVDVLDKALLRPGRFDRKVTINLPTQADRELILNIHSKGKPLNEDVDMHKVAGITVGFSGADLGNLINEAAILAGRKNSDSITMQIIQESIEKVAMGTQRKSLRMSEHERRLIAYHEVGHALVGKFLPNTDPVHKVSILSRGGALGVTWFVPDMDRVLVSKKKFEDELAALYGWRVAEEVFFGKDAITTGASNDIEKATQMARDMIMKYGFDSELGPENLEGDTSGGSMNTPGNLLSQHTLEKIDAKVRTILLSAYDTTTKLITQYRDLHEKIAEELLIKEELTQAEFDAYFEGLNVPVKI